MENLPDGCAIQTRVGAAQAGILTRNT